MNDFELPDFDDEPATAVQTMTPSTEVRAKPSATGPDRSSGSVAASAPPVFDTSTSHATVPPRMQAVEVKCRCGSKMGYKDPTTPRPYCAGCGRNL